MTEILVLEKPEEKLRRERERLLGELSVYGERLVLLQDTVDEIKEMIEYYDEAIENQGTDHAKQNSKTIKEAFADMNDAFSRFDVSGIIHNKKDDESIYLLKRLLEQGYKYIARDKDDCLWVYGIAPTKWYDVWATCYEDKTEEINKYSFPEVKWAYDEPTEIAELLEAYENGGENGK